MQIADVQAQGTNTPELNHLEAFDLIRHVAQSLRLA